jgi:hypothetical protein
MEEADASTDGGAGFGGGTGLGGGTGVDRAGKGAGAAAGEDTDGRLSLTQPETRVSRRIHAKDRYRKAHVILQDKNSQALKIDNKKNEAKNYGEKDINLPALGSWIAFMC